MHWDSWLNCVLTNIAIAMRPLLVFFRDGVVRGVWITESGWFFPIRGRKKGQEVLNNMDTHAPARVHTHTHIYAQRKKS
jgi:hypothetical protein